MTGRRRPGTHGPAALLLAGTLSLGVGVLFRLDDDRTLVADDLGSVPASTATIKVAAPRPLAERIPVLSGLDDILRPPDTAPTATGAEPTVAGAAGAVAGSASSGADAVGSAPPGTALLGTAPPGATPPGSGLPGSGPPGSAPPGSALPGTGAAAPSPGGVGGADRSTEQRPVLTDPIPAPVVARPSPRPMPVPETPLAPQEPGLVSALYPLPEPQPSAVRAPVVPVALDLSARAVTAPVDAVGTDPSGGMVVPEQVRTVGWWAPGVLPGGAAGSAVIAGHVDSRTQGLGVLSVLPQLTEGEPVQVRDATGRAATFRVAARREYGKYDLPREVFRRDGPPQLVLITCGGRFDPAAGSYESNVVVYATPT